MYMIHELLNKHCYNFEYIKYSNGIFDSFVDVTYIITINDIENVINKLKTFNPTSNIIIVKNKTYKECNKLLYEQDRHHDLTDANINIIYHSIKNNYNNIMVLEDDFHFDLNKINSDNHINNIHTFFEKKKDESFIYNIGSLPILFHPFLIDKYHYKAIKLFSTHSLIYNRKIQNKIFDFLLKRSFQYKQSKYYDIFITTLYTNYFYYTPLCYQTNENINDNNISKYYTVHFYTKILDLNKITNNRYELWFKFFIIINYIIYILLVFIILFILIRICNIILNINMNSKNIKNKKS